MFCFLQFSQGGGGGGGGREFSFLIRPTFSSSPPHFTPKQMASRWKSADWSHDQYEYRDARLLVLLWSQLRHRPSGRFFFFYFFLCSILFLPPCRPPPAPPSHSPSSLFFFVCLIFLLCFCLPGIGKYLVGKKKKIQKTTAERAWKLKKKCVGGGSSRGVGLGQWGARDASPIFVFTWSFVGVLLVACGCQCGWKMKKPQPKL